MAIFKWSLPLVLFASPSAFAFMEDLILGGLLLVARSVELQPRLSRSWASVSLASVSEARLGSL